MRPILRLRDPVWPPSGAGAATGGGSNEAYGCPPATADGAWRALESAIRGIAANGNALVEMHESAMTFAGASGGNDMIYGGFGVTVNIYDSQLEMTSPGSGPAGLRVAGDVEFVRSSLLVKASSSNGFGINLTSSQSNVGVIVASTIEVEGGNFSSGVRSSGTSQLYLVNSWVSMTGASSNTSGVYLSRGDETPTQYLINNIIEGGNGYALQHYSVTPALEYFPTVMHNNIWTWTGTSGLRTAHEGDSSDIAAFEDCSILNCVAGDHTSNIAVDPMHDGTSLLPGSPARDAGIDPNPYQALSADQDFYGVVRPLNGNDQPAAEWDIGPWEVTFP